MTSVIIITYEEPYSNRLVEALLTNPTCRVLKIVKGGNLVGNKTFFGSIAFLLRKASLLMLAAKFFEMMVFYAAAAFVPEAKRKFRRLREMSCTFKVPVEVSYDINRFFGDGEHLKDVCLFSIGYYQIVDGRTLSLFKAAFNIHPAPLPEGRGLFPSFWLLLHPTETGRYYQTIHKMVEDVDKGCVVAQLSTEAPPGTRTSMGYMSLVTDLGCRMLQSLDLSRLGNDQPVARYVPGKETVYSYPRTMDVVRFLARGCRFFNWADVRAVTVGRKP